MRNWLLLVLCLCLMLVAQSLWKTGLSRVGVIDLTSAGGLALLWRVVRSWRILTGIAIFGVTTAIWLDLLSRFELSFLYPMMSLVYVFAFFAGWIWLGEHPSPLRLAGILVICLGIYLVSRTGG
jgi:drug/metabolite transporter (DMT)-like permease